MDPASLAIASLAATAVSSVVGTVGAVSTGIANSNAANYQAVVARNNQTIASQNAQQSAAAGATASQARDFRTRAVLGEVTAAQSASGIDTNSGSSREVRQSVDELGRLDTATIMHNAMLQSGAYADQAMNFGAQSTLDTSTASNALAAGGIGAGSSLLGGASSFADKWLRYRTQGVEGFS